MLRNGCPNSLAGNGALEGDVFFAGKCFASAEIADDAARAASGLVALGATGGRVALLMRNDVTFLVAGEAARLAGAVTLPINWHFTADDVAFVLEDSGAGILIAHADLWRRIARDLPLPLMDRLTVLLTETPEPISTAFKVDPELATVPSDARSWDELIADYAAIEEPQSAVTYPLIYTSGTTGRPKGVQRLAFTSPAPMAYDAFFQPGMSTLLAAPLYHAAPNRFLQGTYRIGGTLVLPERFNAEVTLADIECHGVTTTFMVPAMLQRLLRLPEDVRQSYDVSSLRHVVIAGAPCPIELKRAMIDWWGPVIYEYYGSTETSALTFATSEDALARPGTVGRAVATARVQILDEDGLPCPPGVSGEIYGRREDIPDFTYLNAPKARAEAGIGDLVSVGDIGYLDDDGFLFISDRKTDMIISNGTNIYPAQIEAAILSHAAVADCAVFGIPDPAAGEAVAAIIKTVDGQSLEADALTEFLKQKIASYMVPKRIVQRKNFPRDEAGKIKKKQVRGDFLRDADQPS